MFAHDLFPEAAFVAYCEWWYRSPGVDTLFLAGPNDAPPPNAVERAILERVRNAPIALDIAAADLVLCPTQFQAGQFPENLRRLLTVVHDGIDTDFYCPRDGAADDSLDGRIPPGTPLVTYATRGMEPHRGFPQFMAALPLVLAAQPTACVMIAGENRVAYGGDKMRSVDWKARALEEHDLDPARVIFVGRLKRSAYLRLLQRSDAHVYLTVPFVLSWSMLEAMSTACPLVLSDTPPVREFAGPDCAVLVALRSPEDIARGILETLAGGAAMQARRCAARQAVLGQARDTTCFASREALFRSLISRCSPAA